MGQPGEFRLQIARPGQTSTLAQLDDQILQASGPLGQLQPLIDNI